MKRPPEKRDGGPRKEAAASMVKRPDEVCASVKVEQMALWVDEAIATLRRAASDPVEFQRLGIWLQRMRRALP
jgi:hypothetical protein